MSNEANYTAKITVHRPKGEDLELIVETWEDGGVTPEDNKHRNPVTRRETARGGKKSRENLKLSTECDSAVWAIVPLLEDSSGIDRVTCVKQQVDGRDTKIGDPVVVTGVLGPIKPPKYDLSSSDTGMLEIEVSADE